jgi:hypothetical protein
MPDHAGAVQYIAFLGRRLREIKFATEQCVFIVKSFARKKLTENVSASFILNIVTRQFSERRVYRSL